MVLALFAAIAGCGQTEYLCISDVECGAGQCTAAGYCGFEDDSCPSGLRYGEQASAELAKTCVPETDDPDPTTGGPPMPTGDDDTAEGSGGTVAADDGTTGASTTGGDDPGDSDTGVVYDCETWWDPAFSYRRGLVVHAPANGRAVEDFPAMVFLDRVVRSSPITAAEIRVLTEDCELVPHELEPGLDGSPGVVWFRAPSVGPDPISMWLYYGIAGGARGSSDVPDAPDPAAVWDDTFVGVWHFDDFDDSTMHEHALQASGAALFADGPLAQASVFDGVDDRWSADPTADLADLPQGGMTISAWIRPESEFNEQRLVEKKTGSSLSGFGFALRRTMPGLELEVERGLSAEPARWRTVNTALEVGQWAHVAMSLSDADPGSPNVYVGGVPANVSILVPGQGMPLSDVNVGVSIAGSAYDPGVFFDGRLDELRISSEVRTADWLRAEYLSMTGGLVTVGAQETAPTGL